MKSTTITTNIKILQYVSDRLGEIADKMHLDAVAAYPDQMYQALDQNGLELRNCRIHVDHAVKSTWLALNGTKMEAESERLDARIRELEDFYTLATGQEKIDLRQALVSLFDDNLSLKSQIQDLKQKSTEFELPDFVIDKLVEFNFINRNN